MDAPNETEVAHAKDAFYALPDITNRGKFSRSHLYNLLARGQFPQPFRHGPRFTRWSASEVDAWMADPQGWMETNAKTGVEVSE